MKTGFLLLTILSSIMWTGLFSADNDRTGADPDAFTLTSDAFQEGDMIPAKYTCDGENVFPGLHWNNAPEGTTSFALIVDDPDAPMGTWVHYVLSGIAPTVSALPEYFTVDSLYSDMGTEGLNDFGNTSYGGPCPPSGIHRYFFKLYALDTIFIKLGAPTTKEELLESMEGHILGTAVLMGKYQR